MSRVRLALPDDIDKICDLFKEANSKAVYSHLPYNERESRVIIGGLIVSGSTWVTDDVNGVLMACIQPVWFNSQLTSSTDLIFYVRDCEKSAGVKLAKAYTKWAVENVDWPCLSISLGGDVSRTERFYEKLGYAKMGGTYLLKR